MICNTISASDVQHSDSVIHVCVYIVKFFSLLGYYRISNIVPCAIQQVLIIYFMFVSHFTHVASLVSDSLQPYGLSVVH